MTNKSGYHPFEFKVLVEPKEVSEKTKGGIIMPDDVVEREQYANAFGTIVECGSNAFTDPDWAEVPSVGDVIMFDKYAGTKVTGQDGKPYILINDKEIVARVDKE